MINQQNNDEDENEKLRFENELKKMKLMLEHGARFSEPSGSEKLDPLIENKFLNNIEAFENSFQNTTPILLYDFIERPLFIPVANIPESQISTELKSIMNILNINGIQLDTICVVEEREIYRFITEELFLHEVDNMRIPGMMMCFIYEEFHPNHEHDIRKNSIDGIKSYLDKKTDFYTSFFTVEAVEDAGLKHFRDAFSAFRIQHFEITGISIRGINASVNFIINFTGIIEDSKQKLNYAGKGSVELLNQYDYWYIQMINLPKADKHL